MPPTLSVILPTMNRCWTLGRQIDCILPQLGPDDELIIVPNGCNDKTMHVIDSYDSPWICAYPHANTLGVCGAHNKAASYARKDWILGCNDHNELLPGAIGVWRAWATRYPDARVMHGRIDAMQRSGWIEGGGMVPAASLPILWASKQFITHGAETFIRRDSWGAGYRPELEWMADQEQSLTLAMRHGVVDIPYIISHVEFRPGNYSQAHGDPTRHNKVIRAWRALIDTEEFAGVRDQYLMLDSITGHFAERM